MRSQWFLVIVPLCDVSFFIWKLSRFSLYVWFSTFYPHGVIFFLFILFGVHWTSWIYKFVSLKKFVIFSASVSPNILSFLSLQLQRVLDFLIFSKVPKVHEKSLLSLFQTKQFLWSISVPLTLSLVYSAHKSSQWFFFFKLKI